MEVVERTSWWLYTTQPVALRSLVWDHQRPVYCIYDSTTTIPRPKAVLLRRMETPATETKRRVPRLRLASHVVSPLLLRSFRVFSHFPCRLQEEVGSDRQSHRSRAHLHQHPPGILTPTLSPLQDGDQQLVTDRLTPKVKLSSVSQLAHTCVTLSSPQLKAGLHSQEPLASAMATSRNRMVEAMRRRS